MYVCMCARMHIDAVAAASACNKCVKDMCVGGLESLAGLHIQAHGIG